MKRIIFALFIFSVVFCFSYNNCFSQWQPISNSYGSSESYFVSPSMELYTNTSNPIGTFTLTDNGSWIATSTTNAPCSRYSVEGIWTGSKMIIWGGHNYNGYSHLYLNSGGLFDPIANLWTATTITNAPEGRTGFSALWTGSKMIVWGGNDLYTNTFNTGGIYDPVTESWAATSTTNAPEARTNFAAVWTGSKMIVWGGYAHYSNNTNVAFNTGGIYDPVTDVWSPMSTTNAPDARTDHIAVWTGSKMIIWGGMNLTDYPRRGYNQTNYLITTGGGIYDPATDSWSPMSTTNAPSARIYHRAVWTGNKLIIWGGENLTTNFNTGSIYDPLSDSWTSTSTANAPSGRIYPTAAWTGNKMIIWGGMNAPFNNYCPTDGGIYDPISNTWTSTSTENVPEGRTYFAGVWTGNKIIVWGGYNGGSGSSSCLNTGGIYTPPSFNQVPDAPMLITPANNTVNISLTPFLDWNDISNATSYGVQVSTDQSFTNPIVNQTGLTSSQFQILSNTLSSNTLYYWRVNSTNQYGTSVWSTVSNFTTMLGLPLTPTHLEAVADSIKRINLSWDDNSSNEDGFKIERSTDGGNNWSLLNTLPPNDSLYYDNGLTPFSVYFYRVYAYNSYGNSVYSNIANDTAQSYDPKENVYIVILDVNWLVQNNVLNQGQGNSLISKLNAARQKILQGNNNAAINQLHAFLNQTNDFITNHILTQVQAQPLIDKANYIIDQLGGDIPLISGLNIYSKDIPTEYALQYNYPNPFNPTTRIRFDLPKASETKLIIYDMLGREVKVLLNNNLEPGRYEITWNAGSKASGIYFYRLTAGDFLQVKRMSLIK